MPWRLTRLHAAGLVAGPLAVIGGLAAKYALVPLDCGAQARGTALATIAATLIALAGGALSWRALAAESGGDEANGRPRSFIALVSLLAAALSLAAVLLQGAAILLVGACLR